MFRKRHFVKKKCAPHHATGGYLGRSYPEGGPQKTSLGGPYWHLKLGKYDLAAAVYFINLWFLFHFTIACFITEVKFWAEIRFGGKEEGGHQQCGKLIPPVKRPGEIVWKFVWIECWGECINEMYFILSCYVMLCSIFQSFDERNCLEGTRSPSCSSLEVEFAAGYKNIFL